MVIVHPHHHLHAIQCEDISLNGTDDVFDLKRIYLLHYIVPITPDTKRPFLDTIGYELTKYSIS